MSSYKTKGFLNGIFAAVSYGTNPLFALPMYNAGMGVNSVLFYRYFFAVVIYGVWLKFVKKTSFKISLKEFFSLFLLAIIFSLSSLLLFDAFNYIEAGIACTILFVYPIMVAVISAIFFREKITTSVVFSIIMTSVGIFLLYGGKPDGNLNPKGVIYVLLSALAYAIYIVSVKNLKTLKHIKHDKLSFYVMLFGLSVYIWNLNFCTELQPLNSWLTIVCAISLAIFPTIISLETITIAIKLVGSTSTAILGALEPLTAIFWGVLLFSETLTPKIICGIFLILSGVILIILKQTLKKENHHK